MKRIKTKELKGASAQWVQMSNRDSNPYQFGCLHPYNFDKNQYNL